MSKKMWNKIFKTKSNKNSKTLVAANKVNKRCSIYEEYQQLNAALDLTANTEKCSENSLKNYDDCRPLPTLQAGMKGDNGKSSQTTFNKMVNTFTMKRSQNKDVISTTAATGKTGNEKEKEKEKSSESLSYNTTNKSESNVINNNSNNNNNNSMNATTAISDTINNASTTTDSNSNINNNVGPITLNHNNFIAGKNVANTTQSSASWGKGGVAAGVDVDVVEGGRVGGCINNTPYASLSHQLTATLASKPITTVENFNQNINENENFACKQQQPLLSKTAPAQTTTATTNTTTTTTTTTSSTSLSTTSTLTSSSSSSSTSTGMQRLSKIVIVVRKLNAPISATVTAASDLATNRNYPTATNLPTNSDTANTTITTMTTTLTTTAPNVNSYNTTTPTETPDPSVSIQLAPCPICSRTFNPVTLRKHVGICEKMATKKRNIFDSSRQRREGTDLATYPLPKNFGLPEKSSSTTLTRTKSERGQSPNPHQQVASPIMQRKKPSEEFIRSTARTSMRKLSTSSVTEGMTGSTNFTRDRLRSSERSLTRRGIQPLPSEQCPHCDRCFGLKAYDRHVEWCKEKALQAAIKQQASTKTEDNIAKARLEARTKYRAPCLKTKRSINRDKYSGLAGDENEDSSKSLKIGNSLMSMSMTSSITSERKLTKQTGSISEASTPTTAPQAATITEAQAEATAVDDEPINICKDSCDKSHTPSRQDEISEDQQSSDLIAQFEIKMPDFRLMGEQMPTSASNNKKLKSKPLTKSREKTNVPAPFKATKKLKQTPHAKTLVATKCHQRLEADVIHAVTATQKKTSQDLSLKSSRQKYCKEVLTHGRRVYDSIDEDQHEEIHPQAEEQQSPVDLSKSLTFYPTSQKEMAKEERVVEASSLKFNKKTLVKHESKMTMEEYFKHRDNEAKDIARATPCQTLKNEPKTSIDVKVETQDNGVKENRILGSKMIISSRKDVRKTIPRLDITNHHKDDKSITHESQEIMLRHNVANKQKISSDNITMHHTREIESLDNKGVNKQELKNPEEVTADQDDVDKLKEYRNSSNNQMRYPISPDFSSGKGEIAVLLPQNKSSPKNPKNKPESSKGNRLSRTQSRESLMENVQLSRQALNLPNCTNKYSHPSTKETLEKAYEVLARLELADKSPVNSSDDLCDSMGKGQQCLITHLDGEQVTHNHVKDLTEFEKSPASCEVNTDRKNELRTSTSISDTLMKDSDNEEDFKKSPENPTKISPHNIDCDKFRSSTIKFKTLTSPKGISQCSNAPLKKDNKKMEDPLQTTSKALLSLPVTPRIPNTRNGCASKAALPRSESLTTTPRSTTSLRSYQVQAKLETSPVKPLSICQPKRKKMASRQNSSCTSILPMRALPLTREAIEVYAYPRQDNPEHNSDYEEVANDNAPKSVINVKEKHKANELGEDCPDIAYQDVEINVRKEPAVPQLKRNNSFTISGLPDNYDPFLSAKRQLEELCSPTEAPTTAVSSSITTPQPPNLSTTPAASANKMSTSLTLGSSTTPNSSSLMTTSQTPQTSKTPTLARSSSFRRTGSLRCPRRSPLLTQRVPLFAQKHRPTIQRGLSDEGPISTNFMKPEEYDEMPVRSVCVNDYAVTKSPRVVRRDTSASNRKQPLKLNINAANAVGNTADNNSLTPSSLETESAPNTASKYVSKTDSLAVFLKYEHELEKLNKGSNAEVKKESADENANPTTAAITTNNSNTSNSTTATSSIPLANLDGPLNAKELKDKSNNLSKQNSAKNIKADLLDHLNETNENCEINLINNNGNTTTNNLVTNPVIPTTTTVDAAAQNIYNTVRLAPISKPSTPIIASNTHLTKTSTPAAKPSTPATKPSTPSTKPSTPLTKPTTPLTKPTTPLTQPLTPLNAKSLLPLEQIKPQLSQKPVALSSIFGGTKTSEDRKNSVSSDYIDPKLINKCDNLPVNLNKLRNEFKNSDSDTSEQRPEHFSSSSSESSAPPTKFLPSVKPDNVVANNLNQNLQQQPPQHATLSQRNSAEGRNLLKRRIRLGRNQFLYDASPEVDSFSADDEANRSSMECDNFIKEHEKAFDRISAQMSPLDASPFMPPPPLPAEFEDFDFEEFLSSFENDEEQFPLFKDCREFLLNRTSKKQRSMLIPNSNVNVVTQSKKSLASPTQQTFPPLTPQHNIHSHPQQQQHFQFPNLPPHPKDLFDSFSINSRGTKNRYNDMSSSNNAKPVDMPESHQNQKREIFISIETEQNDLDKSSISPSSIRHMVGNPQCVVEVEVDAADNKFSKISDDDEQVMHGHPHLTGNSRLGGNHFNGHLLDHHLPNVQLNNAKNLIQKMQEDFRQMGEEMSASIRQSLEQQRTSVQDGGDMMMMMNSRSGGGKANKSTSTPSGDAYADSDELSSLDGYPLSSPNSRLGVSSKTSADSAYGSLSRQRSSELANPRNSSRNRPVTSTPIAGNTVIGRPLTEERSRQLSASSSSSSEHALPPIGGNNNYQKQQQQHHQQQQQQHHLAQLYSNNINNNNNNNNNVTNDLDEMLRYERNNNFDMPIHPTLSPLGSTSKTAGQQHHTTNHETTPMSSSTQLFASNSTMNSSMKMSKFCHECGSKFLLEQAKFCMDCGVKRICL